MLLAHAQTAPKQWRATTPRSSPPTIGSSSTAGGGGGLPAGGAGIGNNSAWLLAGNGNSGAGKSTEGFEEGVGLVEAAVVEADAVTEEGFMERRQREW